MEETKITTLAQYNQLEVALHDLAGRAKVLTTPDKEVMKELQKMRKFLTETSTELRRDILAEADKVTEKRDEFLKIITGEENRLKRLVEEEKLAKDIEYRKSQFEARRARLATLGVSIEPLQSETMDDLQFEQFYMAAVIEINNERNAALEAREAKVREAEEAQKREAEMKEREDKARKDAEAKAERDIAEANARAERAAEDERNRIARAEAEKAQKEAEEKKKLEADAMYQLFLEKNGWNSTEFHIVRTNTVIKLYKLVDILEI